MCDFDLSQALDGSPDFSETAFEPCCFNMTDVQDEIFRLDEGLDLVVSHNPKSLKSVTYLLLAAHRMKKSLTHCGRELRDDELCSAIMESLVTETIVETTESSSTGVKRIFQRVNSVKLCTLCDNYQKHVVHGSGGLQLQAITLKGGNCERKVNFKLSRYVTPIVSADEGQTVLLSLTNNLHISCSMNSDKAVLNLEKYSEEDLRRISEDGNMDRFLFYKRTKGIVENTFESVKCRGWFISTSNAEDQPLEMCTVDAYRHITFRIN